LAWGGGGFEGAGNMIDFIRVHRHNSTTSLGLFVVREHHRMPVQSLPDRISGTTSPFV
jgi:hypothetical protein